MRILLLGGSGQVGQEIRTRAPHYKALEIVAPFRSEIDLQDGYALQKIIAEGDWQAVINAAGCTNVDRAESEQSVAFTLNAEAPRQLAIETGRRGIPLIHISTDYVFNGRKGKPYVEQDEPAPQNAYGRSKLEGEHYIRAANLRHIILRTAWVYSPFRSNFVKSILHLARTRDRLTVVADQRGCPTAASDVARACLEIANRFQSKQKTIPFGVHHFAGIGDATWHDFANTIVEMSSARMARVPQIVPIPTSDYPTAAARPADTRLDCSSIVARYGLNLRPWRDALQETINRLLPNKDIA